MAETLRVRVARPGDLAVLDAMMARSYPKLLKADYPPSVLVTALPLISRAQPRLLASGSYYVCEAEGGEILGAGGWTPVPGTRDLGDVRHVATDDRHTRRGVARAILLHVFATAHAGGIRRLQCKATRTAVPFYRAMGFVEQGGLEIELRPGIHFPAIAMSRGLP